MSRCYAEAGEPWLESSARLARMLETSPDEERCLAVLKSLNARLGNSGYPAFLKLLLIVAESTNIQAKRRLADAIALGLRRGDAPSGVLTSWGATRFWSTREPLRAGMLPGNLLGVAPRRMLDPIAYLTVWFSQRTHRPYLSESVYRDCLALLIELFNLSSAAREWYPIKIEADLAGIEGAFTRYTRQRLNLLAEGWKSGQAPRAIAEVAAGSLATGKP